MALFNQQTQYTTDVSSVNKEISTEAASSAQFFGQLIAAEHAHNAQNSQLMQQIGPLIGKTIKGVQDHRKIIESREDAKTWELTNEEFNVKYKGKSYEDHLAASEAQAALEQTAGAETNNPLLRGMLWNGDRDRKNNKKMLLGMSKDHANWLSYAGANFEIEYPPGSGNFITRDEANTAAEYNYAQEAIRSVWLKQAAGEDDNPTNLYERRKYLHEQMKKDEEDSRLNWVTAQDTAIKANAKLERNAELRDDVAARGGAAIVDHINKYVGVYGGPGGYRQSRIQTFDNLVADAQAGNITRAHLKDIANHMIDGRDGQQHKLSEYWRADYNRLLKAVTDKERENIETKEQIQTNKQDNWALKTEKEWLDSGKPVTEAMIAEKLEEYKREFPGESKLPALIGEWYTVEDQADSAIVEKLEQKVKNGGQVRTEDLKGITDFGILEKWQRKAKESSILGLSEADIKRRDGRIKTEVDAYTKEAHALGKSPKWQANKENATAYFSQQYQKYMKANPDNPAGAFSEAWKDTKAAIWNKDFDNYQETPIEESTARNTQKALNAFSKDHKVINTAVLPGTKDALAEVAKYVETEGRQGSIPGIYRVLASHTGASPLKVAMTQLNLAAQADGDSAPRTLEAQVDKDVENQLSFSDRILLLKKSSQGKTNRVLQNAETLDWLLDNSKRFDDYDYILSPTGGDAHLEKPLTEHTISEVIGLLESGHEAPGAYAFTPTELLEALQATGIPGDRLYDEVTQDLLTLNLYRAHANRNFRGGFYNELVELSPIQLEQAEEITENIPPFNRSENILKALHSQGGNVPVTQ